MWEQLKSDRTKEDLVRALMAEYEAVDNATAEKDVVEFISLLKSHGFLSE